jgi:hypothetical protein
MGSVEVSWSGGGPSGLSGFTAPSGEQARDDSREVDEDARSDVAGSQ